MSSETSKILVAEDNPALAGVVRFNLERAGFDVTMAANGREAWEIAEHETFDLIVTDQQMPEMTGIELCQQLRQAEMHAKTPVVMLTAKGLELDRQALRDELKVVDVLPKPFSPFELVQTIEECLASSVGPSQA